MIWFFILAFAIAGLTAAILTPLVRRLALHVGMLDQSDDRRMHELPKPRIGGLAVYLGFATALFMMVGFAIHTPHFKDPNDTHQFFGLLFGGTLIVCVGVWDDIMGMTSRNKFCAQIIVSLISMFYGFIIPGIADPFHHDAWVGFPLWLSVLLTLFWYLGMMNAINFIDGLDGLLAGVTSISGVFLFAIALGHGHLVEALILAALVGGALGFLPYNFNPAKIILGDSGSLFIGYVFATVSIMTTSKVAIAMSLLIPILVLGLPIADTAVAIVRRIAAGKKITDPDRGHFHHQLVFRFGLDVKSAVLLIYAVCFVLGAVAFVISGGLTTHRIVGFAPHAGAEFWSRGEP